MMLGTLGSLLVVAFAVCALVWGLAADAREREPHSRVWSAIVRSCLSRVS